MCESMWWCWRRNEQIDGHTYILFALLNLLLKKPHILLGSSKDESYSAQAACSLSWYNFLVSFVEEEKQLWQLLFLELFVFRANYKV